MSESLTSKTQVCVNQLRDIAQAIYSQNAFRAGQIDDIADVLQDAIGAQRTAEPPDAILPKFKVGDEVQWSDAQGIWRGIIEARDTEVRYRVKVGRSCSMVRPESELRPSVTKSADPMPDAARDVLAERERQKNVEGWTPAHDDGHKSGDLAAAALGYTYNAMFGSPEHAKELPPFYWPWDKSWWKPTTVRRDLVKAGALILAEIERIDRSEQP